MQPRLPEIPIMLAFNGWWNNLHAEKGYVHLVRTRLLGGQVRGISVTQ